MIMKIALVHDYLNEFGGAERVLEVLAEMYPKAPIYTAFYRKEAPAYKRFSDRQIITSWAQSVPFFASKLHSPLRFLAPKIWNSLDLTAFDVVISSASWYITKGFGKKLGAMEICYCHTPPRYLYGYDTSVNWQKHLSMKIYAGIVNKGLRQYDYEAAQRVDYFVANSKNVQGRIAKFYRRESTVIYPPVEITQNSKFKIQNHNLKLKTNESRGYYLVISRLVGGKGLEMAVMAANKLKVPLKVVGVGGGYSKEEQKLKELAGPTVSFESFVTDKRLSDLYAGARAFLALARDEDFGITPIEAMMCGTPVVAYRGGGYKETVIDGKTGVLFDDYSAGGLVGAMGKFEVQSSKFKTEDITQQAQKFSKERFVREMGEFVENRYQESKQPRGGGAFTSGVSCNED